MKKLIWTPHFIKAAEKFVKLFPEEVDVFKERLKMMEEDIYNPSLKTHKLKGKLTGFYASSINYSHMILFQFDNQNNDLVILLNIGSHNEIY